MTTEEVQITVEKTETDEIHICDGCGKEIDGDGMKFSTHTVFVNSDKEPPEPLHFCGESCVDSVRATNIVLESESDRELFSGIRWMKRLFQSPYDDVHRMHIPSDYTVAAIPAVGPFMLYAEARGYECEGHWNAALFGLAMNIGYALALLLIVALTTTPTL